MKSKIRSKLNYSLLALCTCAMQASFGQVPQVFDVENRGADCNVSPGALANNTKLPDPFAWTNGSGRITTFEEWSCRRNEIKADLEEYEIGPKPEKPSNLTATYTGGTLTVKVTVGGQTLTLTSKLTIPSGTGPHPVIIGMNSPTGGLSASLFSGCITMPFNHDQVVNYNMQSQQSQNDPYYKIYPELWGKIGNYSAWSWGISRLIDGLEIVKDQINVDLNRISVTGCSYAGKMALFGGALDERIALTLVQESGGGGINSWRLSQAFTDRTGTSIEKIDNTNYSWFKQSMKNLKPNSLPHDHHELIAMIAPRAVLIFGNPYQEWLGDESGYKSAMAALEVWKSMGIEDRFGFDFASGHNHCAAATSQNTAATAFIDKFLKDKTANTKILAGPVNPAFELTYTTAIDWTTPDLAFNPNGPKVKITSPIGNSAVPISTSITIEAEVTDPDNNVSIVEFFVNDTKIGEDATAPYSLAWTNDAKGSYTIEVTATDRDDNTGTSSIKIMALAPQSPYNGTPHAIPGKIEFEEYDQGGQDSAYYDSSPGSSVTPAIDFRAEEDVDIEECDDTDAGYNIGWTMAGEWLEYTVNVTATGTYSLAIRVACNEDDRTISIDANGVSIGSNIAIPNTTGWQKWETITIDDIALTAGKQIIRVTIGAENYVNLNHMTFSPISVDEQKIALKAGWNIVGCPIAESTNIEKALSSIWPQVISVKDANGFWNESNPEILNSLAKVAYGKGYMVKVKSDCDLDWIVR